MLGGFAVIALWIDLTKENAKKRKDTATETARSMRSLGLEDLGNRHPDFYYLI